MRPVTVKFIVDKTGYRAVCQIVEFKDPTTQIPIGRIIMAKPYQDLAIPITLSSGKKH